MKYWLISFCYYGKGMLRVIRLIEPNELKDPKLRAAADRIADCVIFAGQKLLLHLKGPAAFPIPVKPSLF